MPEVMLLPPELAFTELDRLLARAGWTRRPLPTATPSLVPGEPEVAVWGRLLDRAVPTLSDDADTELVYTFNPAVGLRLLELSAPDPARERERLVTLLPIQPPAAIATALEAADPREVLRGILAAQATQAVDLAGRLGLLAASRDPTVARAAARAHLALLERHAALLVAREDLRALAPVLNAIAGNALPALAALPGARDDELLGLKPTEEDCAEVFSSALAPEVFGAYDQLWAQTPPRVEVEPLQEEISVSACPAELFGRGTPLSRRFPEGYAALAPYLRPGRIWLAWRYSGQPGDRGISFDGLVHVRDSWIWFPKPYREVGKLLAAAPAIH